MAYQVVNQNHPLKELYAGQVTLLREFYDFAKKAGNKQAAFNIAAYMWVKVNYSQIGDCFEVYKNCIAEGIDFHDAPNLIVLGSKIGVPSHLKWLFQLKQKRGKNAVF